MIQNEFATVFSSIESDTCNKNLAMSFCETIIIKYNIYSENESDYKEIWFYTAR